jgi:type 1 fimbria pilin
MVRKFVIVLGVAAAFLAASVFAADANAPKPKKPEAGPRPPVTVKLEGTISVTKDSNDVVTSIRLTTANKTVYHVALDEKGKELGGLNGKEVEVRCMITRKDDQKWIKVNEFRLVEKKKETPLAEPKPKSTPPKPEK